jgi:hypothetical protein
MTLEAYDETQTLRTLARIYDVGMALLRPWACNGPGTTWHLVVGRRTACGRIPPIEMYEGGDIRIEPRCKTCAKAVA